MDAPGTVEEVYKRKKRARNRFVAMTLIEKIEAMAALRRDLDSMFGHDQRKGLPREDHFTPPPADQRPE